MKLMIAACFVALISSAVCFADEKIPEGLIGTWHSQDADKQPIVFEKDGTFHYGWKKDGADWKMVTGKFSIDPAGKITAELRTDGVVFKPWFKFKDGMVTGPRGPAPMVTWKKEEKK
ncbi:MAG TPA: hypothetical protein VHR66_13345 [Gemmataceae bacterium]|jgi:hypothetical protein|nr:hypothetical protein [Gemmataceae bacterium]